MEIKRLTGRIFKPAEYKGFTKCVSCGIVVKNKCKDNDCQHTDSPCKSHYCEKCELKSQDRCKVCSGVFREPDLAYTYDIRELKRDNGMEFKVSKVLIREFEYIREPITIRHKNDICTDCVGFEEKIKNHCYMCAGSLENSVAKYIQNGNLCEFCVFVSESAPRPNLIALEIL